MSDRTYLYPKRDINGMHAAFLIAEYQKYKQGRVKIQIIADMISTGDHPADIQKHCYSLGWDFLEDIYHISRFMFVLDEARQN